MAKCSSRNNDVESQRPLLDGSKSEGAESSLPKQLQQQGEDSRILGNCKPPDNGENYSILFKAVVAVIIYFAAGIITFYFANFDLFGAHTSDIIDALYFCVVTLTTVGYGDLVPITTMGKLFTSLYVFVGFGLVGALVSGAANYLVDAQEKILLKAIKFKKQKDDYESHEETEARNATGRVMVSGALVLALFVGGIIFDITVEKMTFVDALYCVCVTITTLGYGDHSFSTATGRLFAALWILSSTVSVAQFFLYLAEWRTESRQLKLAHWVLHRKTTEGDLQSADMDGDGKVSAPEFVLFKLKELGKIEEEDVAGILQEFHNLDQNRSGHINTEDLKAQGSGALSA